MIKFNNVPPRVSSDVELTGLATLELRRGFDGIVNCNNAEHDPGLGDLFAVGNAVGQIIGSNLDCTPDKSVEVATTLAHGLINRFLDVAPKTPHRENGMQSFLQGVEIGVTEIIEGDLFASMYVS